MFNAVPTTDWGSPETLEYWRQAWAELCNAKFAEKGLDIRIDHRSYERQGVELLPTCLLYTSVRLVGVSNRHVTDGSLDFGQRKDVFHQLCHFGCLLYTSRCV